jgi:hypothetical protein
VSVPGNCRESCAAIFASLLAAALLGCNSGAQRDVYQQKMAGEIRILEDQLYDADYHNRVLSDELERCRVKTHVSPAESKSESNHSALAPKSSVDDPIPDPIQKADSKQDDQDEQAEFDMDEGFGDDELELPPVETGEPIEPEALQDPEVPELSAPGLPEPPGKDDITLPPIDQGEVLPPPVDGGVEQLQPGRIELPDSVSSSSNTPEKLMIHSGFSTGVNGDRENNEMTIVIHVVDKLGRTVNLDDFDVDAELSIVLLDPARDASEARIGRWDFPKDQIAELVRREPISGLHVPIKWHGDRPAGKEVVVHARLRAEEDEMRCTRRLGVVKKKAIAEWTPRGDDDIRR